MSDVDSTIADVRATAERFGLPALSREAGVPYTTVQTFAKRNWTHKSLEVLKKLAAASRRMNGGGSDGGGDGAGHALASRSTSDPGAAPPAGQLAKPGGVQ